MKIAITIEGLRPLLMHSPAGMLSGKKSGKKVIPTPEEDAAAGCYWMPDKSSLMLPGHNIFTCFLLASKAYRVGPRSIRPYLAGSIEVVEEFVPFGTKDYEIDTRTVVIQGQRILRSRPKLFPWKLDFHFLVSEQDLPSGSGEMLKPILEEAGRRLGLGDYRLGNGGPFGKFAVTRWEELK